MYEDRQTDRPAGTKCVKKTKAAATRLLVGDGADAGVDQAFGLRRHGDGRARLCVLGVGVGVWEKGRDGMGWGRDVRGR